MTTKVPGCSDCPKTRAGGRSLTIGAESSKRYQVRSKTGEDIGTPFSSVVAAATFMSGHPGATVHDIKPT